MKKYIILLFALLLLLAGCRQDVQQAPPPTEPTEAAAQTQPPTQPEPTQPEPTEPPFVAQAAPDTDPACFGTQWEIYVNGEMAERFFNEWIPLEERYFDGMNVRERCDMIILADDKIRLEIA